MFAQLRVMAFLLIGIATSSWPSGAHSEPVQLAPGIQFELLERWDVAQLNKILEIDTPEFAGIPVTYTPAKNAVRLYRVTYASVIPERGNKPTVATGLLAIPDTDGTTFPIVSYQHGTVYEKQQVPSFPAQSSETQLMIAQFAGQGYVLIGADYFGMGLSTEPEGYMVKASHQQAVYDMQIASRGVLDHMKIATTDLYLAGWSQGGFVTMAALEKFERSGVAVKAAATASAPVDVFVALNGFLNFPRRIDAPWVTSLYILSSFAFENYYGMPGLARSVINDDYYEVSRKAYEKQPFNAADVPTDVRKLVRAEYFDTDYFADSAFGKLAAATQAYRWVVKSPVRNYYGESDEVISVGLGQLAATYQHAIGSGNQRVEAVSTGDTTHRGTFARAVPQWKDWFDGP